MAENFKHQRTVCIGHENRKRQNSLRSTMPAPVDGECDRVTSEEPLDGRMSASGIRDEAGTGQAGTVLPASSLSANSTNDQELHPGGSVEEDEHGGRNRSLPVFVACSCSGSPGCQRISGWGEENTHEPWKCSALPTPLMGDGLCARCALIGQGQLWRARVAATCNRVYYWHTITRTVTWSRPPIVAVVPKRKPECGVIDLNDFSDADAGYTSNVQTNPPVLLQDQSSLQEGHKIEAESKIESASRTFSLGDSINLIWTSVGIMCSGPEGCQSVFSRFRKLKCHFAGTHPSLRLDERAAKTVFKSAKSFGTWQQFLPKNIAQRRISALPMYDGFYCTFSTCGKASTQSDAIRKSCSGHLTRRDISVESCKVQSLNPTSTHPTWVRVHNRSVAQENTIPIAQNIAQLYAAEREITTAATEQHEKQCKCDGTSSSCYRPMHKNKRGAHAPGECGFLAKRLKNCWYCHQRPRNWRSCKNDRIALDNHDDGDDDVDDKVVEPSRQVCECDGGRLCRRALHAELSSHEPGGCGRIQSRDRKGRPTVVCYHCWKRPPSKSNSRKFVSSSSELETLTRDDPVAPTIIANNSGIPEPFERPSKRLKSKAKCECTGGSSCKSYSYGSSHDRGNCDRSPIQSSLVLGGRYMHPICSCCYVKKSRKSSTESDKTATIESSSNAAIGHHEAKIRAERAEFSATDTRTIRQWHKRKSFSSNPKEAAEHWSPFFTGSGIQRADIDDLLRSMRAEVMACYLQALDGIEFPSLVRHSVPIPTSAEGSSTQCFCQSIARPQHWPDSVKYVFTSSLCECARPPQWARSITSILGRGNPTLVGSDSLIRQSVLFDKTMPLLIKSLPLTHPAYSHDPGATNYGLFNNSRQIIPAGTLLGDMTGLWSQSEGAGYNPSKYVLDCFILTHAIKILFQRSDHGRLAGDERTLARLMRFDVDAQDVGNEFRFLNAGFGYEVNTRFEGAFLQVKTQTGKWGTDPSDTASHEVMPCILVWASRDIAPGCELKIDYGSGYPLLSQASGESYHTLASADAMNSKPG